MSGREQGPRGAPARRGPGRGRRDPARDQHPFGARIGIRRARHSPERRGLRRAGHHDGGGSVGGRLGARGPEPRTARGDGAPGDRVTSRRPGWKTAVASALLVATTTSSCAYYNTMYLAKRCYERATPNAPYVVDKPDPAAVGNFSKSIDYSKKLIADYPKSKWVDDAYLLWARSLLGRDDPIGTVNMLKDFPTRYPRSPLKDNALF